MTNKQEFDAGAFYSAIDRTVRLRAVTWKDVSKATGVSQTTLTRMGQGRKPDAASMAALSAWAGVNPASYVSKSVAVPPTGQTLEQVALLFRQDAALTADARKKLETIVESAYNALKTTAEPGTSPE